MSAHYISRIEERVWPAQRCRLFCAGIGKRSEKGDGRLAIVLVRWPRFITEAPVAMWALCRGDPH